MIKASLRIAFILILFILITACRPQSALSAENLNISVDVTDSLVGETTLLISVEDGEGNPLENPGKVSLRGDMDHAGMVPVLRESDQSENGVFSVPFEWTMTGSWMVEVTLTLENGDVITETFDFEILTEASEDEMDNMDDMDHGGETSAVYMSISNNGEDSLTIINAETDVARLVEIHETVVENDVARMNRVESIVLEAGESVELMPGGKHIMLMQLTQDIVADDEIEVSLQLDNGDSLIVTAVVQDMMMDDLEATFEVGDLTIRNVWARPASSGSMEMDEMGDMDSEETETPESD